MCLSLTVSSEPYRKENSSYKCKINLLSVQLSKGRRPLKTKPIPVFNPAGILQKIRKQQLSTKKHEHTLVTMVGSQLSFYFVQTVVVYWNCNIGLGRLQFKLINKRKI